MMVQKKVIRAYLYYSLIAVILMTVFFSCSHTKNFGKLRMQPATGKEVTLGKLWDDWTEFDIFFTGLHENHPTAIVFDPIEDDKTLTGEPWTQIRDQYDLWDRFRWMDRAFFYNDFVLYEILDADNQLYGYIYTSTASVWVKKIDEKTMWVGNWAPNRYIGGDDPMRW
jgi:hypothetical protein